MTKDEMVGCHHQLKGYEFARALEHSKGQGSLVFIGLKLQFIGLQSRTQLSD